MELRQAQAKTDAKDWKEAIPLWRALVKRNPYDGGLQNSLASALYHAQEYGAAAGAYEAMFGLGLDRADAIYSKASCLALLGQRDAALAELKRAVDLGFTHTEAALGDDDWASLRSSPQFLETLGHPDVSRLSRDEGWRVDLQVLEREALRKGYRVVREFTKEDLKHEIQRISDAVPTLSDMQVAAEIMKLLRKMGDGHTAVLGWDRPTWQETLPLQFYLFEEGLYVIAADPKYSGLVGSRVITLGGATVEQIKLQLDPLISRDNEIWPRQKVPYLMRHVRLLAALGLLKDEDRVMLTVESPSGGIRQTEVVADASQPDFWNVLPGPASWSTLAQQTDVPLPLYRKNLSSPYWFEYLAAQKLVYLQYNVITEDASEPFDKFLARFWAFVDSHEVDKLVIDLRWNNGGNTALLPPLIAGLQRRDKINQRGKLFAIVGRRTFSAAQNAAAFLDRYTNVIFAGEPTGSSPNFVGEEAAIVLPYSKLKINVSDLYWETSWPTDTRRFIAPLLYVPPSFAAYEANQDPVMDAILAYK